MTNPWIDRKRVGGERCPGNVSSAGGQRGVGPQKDAQVADVMMSSPAWSEDAMHLVHFLSGLRRVRPCRLSKCARRESPRTSARCDAHGDLRRRQTSTAKSLSNYGALLDEAHRAEAGTDLEQRDVDPEEAGDPHVAPARWGSGPAQIRRATVRPSRTGARAAGRESRSA